MSRRIEARSIIRPAGSLGRGAGIEGASVDLGVYWDRLQKLIPGEIAALYVGGTTVIPAEQSLVLVGWTLFCLLAVIVFFIRQTSKDPKDPRKVLGPDKAHVAISAISFVIWVYTLGGPFQAYGLHVGWLALLLMLGWTFLASPFLYPNPPKGK